MIKILVVIDEPGKKELLMFGGTNRHEFFEELLDFVKNEQIYYRHYENVIEYLDIIRKKFTNERCEKWLKNRKQLHHKIF